MAIHRQSDVDPEPEPWRFYTSHWKRVKHWAWEFFWEDKYTRAYWACIITLWILMAGVWPRAVDVDRAPWSWLTALTMPLIICAQLLVGRIVDTVERWDSQQEALDEQMRKER